MSIVGVKQTRELANKSATLKSKLIKARKKGLSVVIHNGKTHKVGKV